MIIAGSGADKEAARQFCEQQAGGHTAGRISSNRPRQSGNKAARGVRGNQGVLGLAFRMMMAVVAGWWNDFVCFGSNNDFCAERLTIGCGSAPD